MSTLKRYGLVPDPAGRLGPMLRPDTPPVLNPGRPFADDLDECDRRFGVPPRPPGRPRTKLPPLAPPDPSLPLPKRAHFVPMRVGYAAALPALEFTIAAVSYGAKSDLAFRRAPSAAIVSAVEGAFGVKRKDLVSGHRAQWIVRPRQALCLLLHEWTDWSMPRIGRALGGRDHSTIIHAIARGRYFAENDPDFAAALAQARGILEVQFPPIGGEEGSPC